MRSISSFLIVVLALAIVSPAAQAQAPDSRVTEARAAISRGEFSRAAAALAELTRQNPSPDAFLYLGIAYGNMKEYAKAEEAFLEGARRYPADARFHNELAGTYLAKRDTDQARDSLKDALRVEPTNEYAADLLANIDMSEGNVRSALDFWNRSGRPVVSEILHNRYPGFGHWTVEKAVAFKPGETLRFGAWRTTERRLFQTELYTNVGVDVEPTAQSGRYDVDVRTTLKKNTRTDLAWGVIRGLPFQSVFLDVWNVQESGMNLNSFYRWQPERRRADVALHAPLPLPGILFLDVHGIWRSEEWNISDWTVFGSAADRFDYKSTGGRIMLRHIPTYRVELAGGIEYRNRAINDAVPAIDAIPGLFLNGNNTAKLLMETTIALWDRGDNRGRLFAEGYLARRSIMGDLNYSGGVVELDTRWVPRGDFRNSAVWTMTAGTTRGQLPIDDYFVVGVQTYPRFLLRGHSVTHDGVSGAAPLGSAFVLSNTTFAREIMKIPTFNSFNLPFIAVKGEFFVDVAKVFDRARIFKQDNLFADVGVGLRFASPTHALHLIYGQSTTDGRSALTAYFEKSW